MPSVVSFAYNDSMATRARDGYWWFVFAGYHFVRPVSNWNKHQNQENKLWKLFNRPSLAFNISPIRLNTETRLQRLHSSIPTLQQISYSVLFPPFVVP